MKKVIGAAAIILLGIILFVAVRNSINDSDDDEKSLPASKDITEPPKKPSKSDKTPTKGEKVTPTPSKITVIIDAGHGDTDTGCIFDEIYEKDVNLAVALKVKEKLEELEIEDLEVILTRDTDVFVSLEDRAKLANRSKAVCFVSIHCNSFDDHSMNGFEGYYWKSEKGRELSECIFDAAEKNGVNVRKVREEEYFVLRETAMPATLLEIGYMSNAQERRNLTSEEYQEKISKAIVEGINVYLFEE